MTRETTKKDSHKPFGSATSYDVARLAGVSQSAVSRCFQPHASISEKTRKKVLAAAAELHYAPNAIARSLITRRSNIVAVMVTETTTRVTPDILFELNVALLRRGMHLLLFSITQERDHGDIVGEILRYKVDGVIACTTMPAQELERCQSRGIPVVLYNRIAPGQNNCSVGCDHIGANRDIADRLYRSGHRHFAFLAGPADAPVAEQRKQGLLQRLQELAVGPVEVVDGDFGYQSGHAAMLALYARGKPIDAVVCANDDMAFGAMDAARYALGLRIPQDVSVVGFDDVASAERAPYQLTTVRQPVGEMARMAVHLLLEHIEDRTKPPVVTLLPGQLMRRQSARLAD
ncbi:MAG: LacI family DNA-binding transcriptional regulator [Rhodoferax sp.]|nr:LacI family DNA-binding transcriptional regulator [Rhodoferax sp.]